MINNPPICAKRVQLQRKKAKAKKNKDSAKKPERFDSWTHLKESLAFPGNQSVMMILSCHFFVEALPCCN